MLSNLSEIDVLDNSEPIGEGSFSKVLKCRLRSDGKVYALKMVNVSKMSRSNFHNLRAEIRIHEQLNHPHIIKYLDSMQIGHMVYILLEFAPKNSLFYYIHPTNGISEDLALRFLYQMSLAVKHLHDRGIIHRDIKPENILLDDKFNVKLCDFGWSCELKNEFDYRTSVCGTFEYMSPEVSSGSLHDEKIDVWCLGIMMIEMLTGNPPFKAESVDQIRTQLATKTVPIPPKLRPQTAELLAGMLQGKPQRRFSIHEVVKQLELAGGRKEFFKPLSERDFGVLMRNFFINTHKKSKSVLREIDNVVNRETAGNSGVIAKPQESSSLTRSALQNSRSNFSEKVAPSSPQGLEQQVTQTPASIQLLKVESELSSKAWLTPAPQLKNTNQETFEREKSYGTYLSLNASSSHLEAERSKPLNSGFIPSRLGAISPSSSITKAKNSSPRIVGCHQSSVPSRFVALTSELNLLPDYKRFVPIKPQEMAETNDRFYSSLYSNVIYKQRIVVSKERQNPSPDLERSNWAKKLDSIQELTFLPKKQTRISKELESILDSSSADLSRGAHHSTSDTPNFFRRQIHLKSYSTADLLAVSADTSGRSVTSQFTQVGEDGGLSVFKKKILLDPSRSNLTRI